jgi:hypothetical protein
MRTRRRRNAVPTGGHAIPSAAHSSPLGVAPAHEAIALRAYLKWQARGRPHGTALQDWLAADAELRAETNRGARI